MELYLKTGYSASMYVRKGKSYNIRGRQGNNVVDQYHVHRKQTAKIHLRDGNNIPNYSLVDYDGMVYCATVPNGALVIRRNGKMVICGNCLIQAAVAANILGLKPHVQTLIQSNAGQPDTTVTAPATEKTRRVASAPPNLTPRK